MGRAADGLPVLLRNFSKSGAVVWFQRSRIALPTDDLFCALSRGARFEQQIQCDPGTDAHGRYSVCTFSLICARSASRKSLRIRDQLDIKAEYGHLKYIVGER